MIHKVKTTIGNRVIEFETGRLAKQAGGSVLITCGETTLLVTACGEKEAREGADFFPLMCEYKENTFSVGRIPGGFFKREGRPSTNAVLTSRLIDRPLRPMFPDDFRNEVQVIANVYSFDLVHEPEILAITAASAALVISPIPFPKPIAAVRVGLVDGEFIVNPTTEEKENSILDLVVAGSDEAIVMVEAGAKEVSEQEMIDALEFAHTHIKTLVKAQLELADLVKPEKWEVKKPERTDGLYEQVEEKIGTRLLDALRIKTKLESYEAVGNLKKEIIASFDEELQGEVSAIFGEIKEKVFRDFVLCEGKRLDDRAFDEIRPITCEVGVLPRTHGSAVFTRGETQALVTTTLGTFGDSQFIDGLDGEENEKFMLHYNFPPFSVGEVKFLRSPGRREIGHGALAKRAIEPVIPDDDGFPYVLRVVSEILESNGSSSMATVCGGILSLMDAGVPIKKPVAGIAMGLVMEGDKYAILSDIAGAEDHYGDMDFKVTGTKDGITALQMDIKVKGLTKELMAKALRQAVEGYNFILGKITETIPEPRKEMSKYAPRISTIMVSPDVIKDIIGPGGKKIKEIIEVSGAKIDITDDGTCMVAASEQESADIALDMIRKIIEKPEVGMEYEGTVKRIENFGAFVEILPGKDGLLHISEIAHERTRNVEDVLKVGDKIKVLLTEIDRQGRLNLSRKALLPKPEGFVEQKREHREGRDRNNRINRYNGRKNNNR
jgi:polyribonucleotide nucleotidyltransferase